MRRALGAAEAVARLGDVPVGALLVDAEGRELALAGNRREQDVDPTAHAEVLALREGARRRGSWRLDGCTLYVTLEPCAMCAGALVLARVAAVVYGARDPKAGALESLYRLGDDPRLNHRFTVRGGVLAEECAEPLRRFFAALRREGQK